MSYFENRFDIIIGMRSLIHKPLFSFTNIGRWLRSTGSDYSDNFGGVYFSGGVSYDDAYNYYGVLSVCTIDL